jgi:sec-independent protein translocase protein TatA
MSPSIWQILIVVAVILLLFGGRKIPRLMKDMGSGITSFRKGLKEGTDGDASDDKKGIEAKEVNPAPKSDEAKKA